MSLREYVVTLHNKQDLESFYEDMETDGGTLCIPQRAVEVANRRLVSRNTHYFLSDEEASQIKSDPRVKAVEVTLKEAGLSLTPCWTQFSDKWSKTNVLEINQNNWGLLRCVEGVQREGWGGDQSVGNVSGEINVMSSGKNVDIVIVDGHLDPNHPEFAKSPDGTNGSRVVQYNWFSLTPLVTGDSAGTYIYTPYVDSSYLDYDVDSLSERTVSNDHGCHVAGIAAGNTQGWARDANIYNISPYDNNINGFLPEVLDYIKIWHQNKPINPLTGIKNPTISNHSYGISNEVYISQISSIQYQGTVYTGPFDQTQLINFGIYATSTMASFPVRNTSYETDILELIEAGVIIIGAAGNEYSKIANVSETSSDDYNNYLVVSGVTYYYNRGSITAINNAIIVGAISTGTSDLKFDISNCGPRVDIYAPGRNIISSVNSNTDNYIPDLRNSNYYFTKKSGTSMASPQVVGVIACLAEQWPTITQDDVKNYLDKFAKFDQITDTGGGPGDYTDLQGSDNKFLYYMKTD